MMKQASPAGEMTLAVRCLYVGRHQSDNVLMLTDNPAPTEREKKIQQITSRLASQLPSQASTGSVRCQYFYL